MGSISDPYDDDAEDALGISISGLPDEPEEPEGVSESGPDEPEGDFDAEAVELADGDRVSVEGTGLDSVVTTDDDDDDLDDDDDDDEGDDLGDPGDEVAYDLTEWEDDQLSTLFDKLTAAELDYLWDGEELFLRAQDEDTADRIIEQVSYPDQLEEESDDGDAGATLLGDIFVAADRLRHDPEEHDAVAALLTLADTTEAASAPYGLADEVWKHLQEKVEALADLLEAETIDIEAATEAAIELRTSLRPYV